MAPIVIAGLIQAGTSIFGGILASNERQEAQDAMNRRLAEIMRKFNELDIPSIEKQKLILEEVKSVGLYTPELEDIIRLGPSAWEGIAVNPELRGNEYEVLKKLDEIIEGGGLNKSDKARILDVADRMAIKARGIREATSQNFRQRGIGGSGLEIAQTIKGDQDVIQEEAKASRDIEARAEERALQAILQKGQLSGQLGDKELNEAGKKASAKDAISRFNTQALMGREGRRVSNANAASRYNLDRDQRVADTNVGIRNQQQQYNKNLIRQNYQDKLAKLKASLGFESQASTNMYNQDIGGANQTQNIWSTLGNIGGKVGGYYQDRSDHDEYLAWLKKNKGQY